MPDAFFWLFSALAVLSGCGVIFSRQAAESAFWMFATLLSISGVMAFLGAYLLSLITLLVYAGAILVLFVFVIMFVGQRLPAKVVGKQRLFFGLTTLTVAAIFAHRIFVQATYPNLFGEFNGLTQSSQYGVELFTKYHLPVQLCGWMLLWVTVGAFNIGQSQEMKEEVRV